MAIDNTTTNTEMQPTAKAEPNFQKEFARYANAAKLDAEYAALEALPFIAKRGQAHDYWAPPSMREGTHDEQNIAYETGLMYAQLLALHCRNYRTGAFLITRVITAALEYAAKHPRKGAQLRAGFLQRLAEFSLAGMQR